MLIQKAELVDQYEGFFYVVSYWISGKLHSKSLLVTNYLKSLCLGTAEGLCICMQHYTEQPSSSLVHKAKENEGVHPNLSKSAQECTWSQAMWQKFGGFLNHNCSNSLFMCLMKSMLIFTDSD